MNTLERALDREVDKYLKTVKDMDEVKALLSGNVNKNLYKKFLKTFYTIEHLSQRAVNMASIRTEEKNPYLSKRFHSCAQGELGHAELALRDLRDMGDNIESVTSIPLVHEYDEMLQKEADTFPLGILGHSYLFENVSGKMFPEHSTVPYPSKFIEVHAKEDPGHSLAIKRTVRNVEKELSDDDIKRIIEFTRKSGTYFMNVFKQY